MNRSQRAASERGWLILRLSKGSVIVGLFVLGVLLVACAKNSGGGASANGSAPTAGGAVNVVAAENFYGDITRQLGGSHVRVTSIINDPNADPHEYESSTADAKAIAVAQLVIENGIGYDSFMDKLLNASPNPRRIVINAGDLLGKSSGDNPHVWYNINWMGQLAGKVTATLSQLDVADQADFTARNQQFMNSLAPISGKISTIKSKYAGTHLTQTEPVFGYMGDALGLKLDDGDFQHALEEGTDPSPQAVANIDQELMAHQVKALLYNSQATSPVTSKVKDLATQNKVPIVGVSETEPAGKNYQQWMTSQLSALQKALGG